MQILEGSADFSQKKQTPSGRKRGDRTMTDEQKGLWKAMVEWLEIAKETDERLRAVRRELDKRRNAGSNSCY